MTRIRSTTLANRTRRTACAVSAFALVTALAADAMADRVVIVLDPPAVETNLSWGGIGERLPSLQALVGHDPETGAFAPTELAREWYANDDFTEWTFHLHEDAEWHGGWGPVTAADVVHSYELHVAPKSYPWNAYACYFADPDGNLWEIYAWVGDPDGYHQTFD